MVRVLDISVSNLCHRRNFVSDFCSTCSPYGQFSCDGYTNRTLLVGDETAMEGTGYTPFHMLRAKKMKLLTLQRAKAASALAYGTALLSLFYLLLT